MDTIAALYANWSHLVDVGKEREFDRSINDFDRYLAGELSKKERKQIRYYGGYVASCLDPAGNYLAAVAWTKIRQQRQEGWSIFAQSLLYRMWANAIAIAEFATGLRTDIGGGWLYPQNLALTSICLSFGLNDIVAWDVSHTLPLIGKPLLLWSEDAGGYYAYILKLACLRVNAEAPDTQALPNDLYGQVFQHWNDAAALSDICVQICDEHIRELTHDHFGNVFSERMTRPFPFEIAALLRVRQDLGLTLPEVRHPLFTDNVGPLPDRLSPVQDEFLEKAIEKTCELLPILRQYPGRIT